MESLKGKKVLIIGGVNNLDDLIVLAHRNGVFVGVADYNKNTYMKSIADAGYDVDVKDIDAIAEICRTEHYDGVISNFVDSISPFVVRIAEKLNFYVPYSEEQLEMSNNKKYFKNKCIEYGVPVPKEYKIENIDTVTEKDVELPVIVKPVDGSGSKGISICRTLDELKEGFRTAVNGSRSGEAVVEQFIPEDEINVTYIAQDGKIQLSAIHDRYFNESQQGVVRVPDLYIYPSRYTDIYLEKYNEAVIRMLEGIGVKNGSLFMQACVKNGEVYFYEAGMRLNGCKTYQMLEVENNFNTLERLLRYSLTGSMGEFTELSPKFKKWYATLNVLGEPGEKIVEFRGLDEINSYTWLINSARLYREGDTIPANSAGTLIQDTTRIHIFADTKEQLIERINKVNELYQLINPEGRNIVLTPHDTNEIYSGLNYEL